MSTRNSALKSAGVGAMGILAVAATESQARSEPGSPTVNKAFQVAQAGPSPNRPRANAPVAHGVRLGQVRLAPGMSLKGNSGKMVSPATAKLLQSLSKAIASSIRNNAGGAGADDNGFTYSYFSDDPKSGGKQQIEVE